MQVTQTEAERIPPYACSQKPLMCSMKTSALAHTSNRKIPQLSARCQAPLQRQLSERSRNDSCSSAHAGPFGARRLRTAYSYRMPSAVATSTATCARSLATWRLMDPASLHAAKLMFIRFETMRWLVETGQQACGLVVHKQAPQLQALAPQ